MNIPVDEVSQILARFPNVKTFVETGTYAGMSLEKMVPKFDRLFSIELSENLYAQCKAKFAGQSKVRLYQGSSRTMMGDILKDVGNVPALFWLDAHWSAGTTARDVLPIRPETEKQSEAGDADCALRWELRAIKDHGDMGHIILVDDMRDMGGREGSSYPGRKEIENGIRQINPDYTFRIIPTDSKVLVAEPKVG
jgi:hypothetical protein